MKRTFGGRRGAPSAPLAAARKRALFCATMLGGLVAATAAAAGPVLPTGGVVKAGSATIGAPSGGSLTVNQTSSKAIIDWSSFGIGQGGTVQFDNGSGATLNRVTGSNISSIDGLLSATGSIYLINPSGVIVGKTGVVNTGGTFVASTLGVANASFLAGGPLTFSGPSTASVVNLGKVSSLGGNVAMIASTVENGGTIAARKGDVGLIAGATVTMDDTDNDAGGLFSVQVGDGSTSATNTGAIAAAAVELRAQQGNVYALAGNTGGVIDATGVDAAGGVIKLISTGGTTTVTGALSAQSPNGTGGQIETSGEALDLGAASVNTHGGSWLLDPFDLFIDATAAAAIDSSLASGSVTLTAGASGLPTETGGSGATGDTSSGQGSIFVESALTWSSASTLTLNAYHAIVVEAPITVYGAGKVALNYGAGGLSFAEGAPLQFLNTPGGGQALSINGVSYTLLYAVANESDATGPDNGLYDLAGIDNNTAAGGDAGHYAVAEDLAWTSTTFAAALIGGSNAFTGTLEGLGNTVSDLTIKAISASDVGLVGQVGTTGVVRDLGLVGANVEGYEYVGALVGYNNGGTVENSYAGGAVLGTEEAGGLVGVNSGTVETSYATDTVGGTSFTIHGPLENNRIGGLVGQNTGSVVSSDATGAVSGSSYVGGLVGFNSAGTVESTYATGAVSGLTDVGGLLGYNTGFGLTKSYFDTQTTGDANGVGYGTTVGVTGLTTAQLQSDSGGYMTDLTAFGGGTGGFYPYLSVIFPTGVQAVTGTAYNDAGITPQAGTTVGVIGNDGALVNGVEFAPVTSGADGYYYAFAPPGAPPAVLTSTSPLLVYDTGGAGILTTSTGTALQTGVNLFGNTVLVSTAATTLSAAPTLAQAKAQLVFADNNNAAATAAIDAATALGLNTTGASFTVDEPVSAGLVVFTPNGAPLTVTGAITLSGNASLGLLSGGALAIDAPITMSGAEHVNLSFSAAGDLGFGAGDTLQFTGAAAGGEALTINGQTYTLLYSVANSGSTTTDSGLTDLAGIDNNSAAGSDNGDYALARSVTAPASTFTTALVGAVPDGFNGILEGLGNTITGLVIASSGKNVGLIGGLATGGTVRDIGVVGGSVTGSSYVGGLAGASHGTIEASYATDAVTSTGYYSGGLVGIGGGTIKNSHAGGSVSGFTFVGGLIGADYGGTVEASHATGAVSGGGSDVGGLVGITNSTTTVKTSYATGAVSGDASGGLIGWNYGTVDASYAAGTVTGGSYVGGLVGYNDGPIEGSHATGAVSGSAHNVGGLVGLNGSTIEKSYAGGSVSGGLYTGGLVGYNDGLVETSYATGRVTGGSYVGGLVGYNYGTVKTSYATGAASGSSYVGGLAGYNYNGAVQNSYATGAVSGSKDTGGLIGLNDKTSTITSAYFDTQTTGQSTGIGLDQNNQSAGVTGLTTAQLQSNAGGYMSNLGTAFAGGTGGLYPYLVNFFPGGVQAVTGTIYSDGGGAPLVGTTIGVIGDDGAVFGTVTSGANGYFYAFAPVGALASGQTLLVYDTADAATLTTATGGALQTGVKLYGTTVTVATAATTLSTAPTLAQARTSATAADGGIAAAATAIADAAGLGLDVTGASFTVNQVVSAPGLVVVTQGGDPLTVADTITVTGAGALGLDSGGALSIDAPIHVTGAGTAVLDYSAGKLSFDLGQSGFGGSLAFAVGGGEGVAGQALTINGQSYTLLYSMTDVAGLNSTGDYALAAPITATGTYAGAVVNNFAGTLEGLGDSISGLTIDDVGGSKVGLIGKLNSGGMIRDIGLAGGSVTGLDDVGDLVGVNDGAITYDFASGNVSAAGGDYVGGLVGDNAGGASITVAISTGGAVTADGGVAVGGLAGYNSGTVTGSSASDTVGNNGKGADTGGLVGYNAAGVASSTAGGTVSGGAQATGGLVGYNAGSISGTSASSAAVSAPATAYYVGGVAGFNAAGGTITGAVANGASVSASGAVAVGGLVGESAGTISNASAHTGSVMGGIYVGGLVGYNASSITASSASDAVYDSASGQITGGLVGDNAAGATIVSGTSSGKVSGGAQDTGGLVGYNAGAISGTSVASGNVSASASDDVGGLVGENAASGTITGATASGNVSAPGSDYVGGLVGTNAAGGAITSAVASVGTVNADGGAAVGGLVGYNSGTVTGSSAGDAVGNDGSGSDTGGLVGYNGGTISSGTASGAVTGGANDTGGLVGDNAGAIKGVSLASGNVSAASGHYVGGLVGDNVSGGTITGASASGTVAGIDDVGGLAGANGGAISSAFATGNVSAPSGDYVGGLVGDNAAGATISSAFATGAVSASGGVAIGGLVGLNDGTIGNTYAYAGAVSGGTDVGGLVGDNDGGLSTSWSSGAVSGTTSVGGSIGLQSGGTLSDLYWDEGTSGKTLGVGNGASTGVTGIGGTTGRSADAQATYAGFNFSTTWTIKPGTSRAYLQAAKPVTPPN